MSEGPTDETAMGDAGSPAGMARRIARICNQRGLHARAAARFVKTVGQFDAEVWVRKNGTKVPGNEILELLLLEAPPGTVIELTASGPQAEAAVIALARLIECKFDED
jgi:phosphocarrier protein HPr